MIGKDMSEKPKYGRGHKMYLDKAQTKESEANIFFACRDGVINSVEYTDGSGYGSPARILLCRDTKHEHIAIIRQTQLIDGDWSEESVHFDSDDYRFFKALITGKADVLGGKFELLRDY